jgi:hypothetical protein
MINVFWILSAIFIAGPLGLLYYWKKKKVI